MKKKKGKVKKKKKKKKKGAHEREGLPSCKWQEAVADTMGICRLLLGCCTFFLQ